MPFMNYDEIQPIVKRAVKSLYKLDKTLLRDKASERSATHMVATYLWAHKALNDWHVDCEYNRMMTKKEEGDTKEFTCKGAIEHLRKQFPNIKKRKLVVPDIIVHIRHQPTNLLVIEAKFEWRRTPKDLRLKRCDQAKLGAFTHHGWGFEYEWGLFLELGKTFDDTIWEWYHKGGIFAPP